MLSKVALQDLGTEQFYLPSAAVSLLTYAPYLALRPPAGSELLPAFGLACFMAVTFGVTTEAIRRGPLGTVSPITALSPAFTAALAILVLHEHIGLPAYLGIALAPAGIVLLSLGRQEGEGQTGWRALAVASLVLQGVGAFVAKLVVTTDVWRTPACVNSITRPRSTRGVNLQADRGGRSGYRRGVGQGPGRKVPGSAVDPLVRRAW